MGPLVCKAVPNIDGMTTLEPSRLGREPNHVLKIFDFLSPSKDRVTTRFADVFRLAGKGKKKIEVLVKQITKVVNGQQIKVISQRGAEFTGSSTKLSVFPDDVDFLLFERVKQPLTPIFRISFLKNAAEMPDHRITVHPLYTLMADLTVRGHGNSTPTWIQS